MSLPEPIDRWLPRPRRGGDQPVRLFCLPYAGGGASIYRRWSEDFPPGIDVCPIHLPGRESRLMEPAFTDVAPLVASLAEALVPYLDRPFALFGHSMGGLIGFELTRHLARAGQPTPAHLFVSASRAPHLPRRGDDIHELSDAAFIDAVRRMAGTPERVLQVPELVQLMLPGLRADFELVETYRYGAGEPLAGPISAFGGVGDDMVDRADLSSWAEQTSGPFALRMLPGNHFFLGDPVARPAVIQVLARELAPLAGASPALAARRAAVSGR
jgi:medium-chain acyl-[acyl-carrier-protein] hydrolase